MCCYLDKLLEVKVIIWVSEKVTLIVDIDVEPSAVVDAGEVLSAVEGADVGPGVRVEHVPHSQSAHIHLGRGRVRGVGCRHSGELHQVNTGTFLGLVKTVYLEPLIFP